MFVQLLTGYDSELLTQLMVFYASLFGNDAAINHAIVNNIKHNVYKSRCMTIPISAFDEKP
jgi:hypothetical protein